MSYSAGTSRQQATRNGGMLQFGSRAWCLANGSGPATPVSVSRHCRHSCCHHLHLRYCMPTKNPWWGPSPRPWAAASRAVPGEATTPSSREGGERVWAQVLECALAQVRGHQTRSRSWRSCCSRASHAPTKALVTCGRRQDRMERAGECRRKLVGSLL